MLGISRSEAEWTKSTKDLPGNAKDLLRSLYIGSQPASDAPDPLRSGIDLHSEQQVPESTVFDKEHFPQDVPEDLIRA